MRNISKTIVPLVMALAVVSGVMVGKQSERVRQRRLGGVQQDGAQQGGAIAPRYRPAASRGNKLDAALSLVGRYYVDPISIDSLVEVALPAVIKNLDPHSVYIPARDLQEVNEPLEGEFDGIGIYFNMATDTILVQNVIGGGPSDKAGIRAGDRIMLIDDSLVAGRKIADRRIIGMLRGPRGTTVRLGVQRPGIDAMVSFAVVRDRVPIRSLDAAFVIAPGTGYIKVSSFSVSTYAEVSAALRRLHGEGARRLVLDLRGNSGGFMDQAEALANEFLRKGQLIVYTEDRNGDRDTKFANGKGRYGDMKLVVLVDQTSASASEILAGAIQDNDRGLIVGRRTFGKGLVQAPFEFGDGSAIRLTVARYYTPSGRSIQKPYTPGDQESYAMDLWDRYQRREYFTVDSTHMVDSLKYLTVGGRVVYGGGGIMPDVFVPVDTGRISEYYLQVNGRNILYRYTIDYSDRHREELDAITTLERMDAFFAAEPGLLDDFIAYAARVGVPADREGIERSRALLEANLKAYIARGSRLEDVGFYAYIYSIDDMMLAALDEVRKL